jgi:hypothetical protein
MAKVIEIRKEKTITVKMPGKFRAMILKQRMPDGTYAMIGYWANTQPSPQHLPSGTYEWVFIYDKPGKKKK